MDEDLWMQQGWMKELAIHSTNIALVFICSIVGTVVCYALSFGHGAVVGPYVC